MVRIEHDLSPVQARIRNTAMRLQCQPWPKPPIVVGDDLHSQGAPTTIPPLNGEELYDIYSIYMSRNSFDDHINTWKKSIGIKLCVKAMSLDSNLIEQAQKINPDVILDILPTNQRDLLVKNGWIINRVQLPLHEKAQEGSAYKYFLYINSDILPIIEEKTLLIVDLGNVMKNDPDSYEETLEEYYQIQFLGELIALVNSTEYKQKLKRISKLSIELDYKQIDTIPIPSYVERLASPEIFNFDRCEQIAVLISWFNELVSHNPNEITRIADSFAVALDAINNFKRQNQLHGFDTISDYFDYQRLMANSPEEEKKWANLLKIANRFSILNFDTLEEDEFTGPIKKFIGSKLFHSINEADIKNYYKNVNAAVEEQRQANERENIRIGLIALLKTKVSLPLFRKNPENSQAQILEFENGIPTTETRQLIRKFFTDCIKEYRNSLEPHQTSLPGQYLTKLEEALTKILFLISKTTVLHTEIVNQNINDYKTAFEEIFEEDEELPEFQYLLEFVRRGLKSIDFDETTICFFNNNNPENKFVDPEIELGYMITYLKKLDLQFQEKWLTILIDHSKNSRTIIEQRLNEAKTDRLLREQVVDQIRNICSRNDSSQVDEYQYILLINIAFLAKRNALDLNDQVIREIIILMFNPKLQSDHLERLNAILQSESTTDEIPTIVI